jgi:competence protein ComEC
VLNPPDPRLTATGSELNDNSVVLRLVYDRVSVLLTGDIDEVGAMRMARLREDVRCTVLKVPHHGSADPAVPTFLDSVRPDLAVISVGSENPFGHPSEEMLGELARVGAKVMRTDRDGAVTVRLAPRTWSAAGSSRWGRAERARGEVEAAMVR